MATSCTPALLYHLQKSWDKTQARVIMYVLLDKYSNFSALTTVRKDVMFIVWCGETAPHNKHNIFANRAAASGQ
jgi:hypothetical protein